MELESRHECTEYSATTLSTIIWILENEEEKTDTWIDPDLVDSISGR